MLKLISKLKIIDFKKLFIERNMNYKMVSEQTKLSLPVIYKVVNRKGTVNFETAKKISELFKKNINELFDVIE